jgi:hypothetical protein
MAGRRQIMFMMGLFLIIYDVYHLRLVGHTLFCVYALAMLLNWMYAVDEVPLANGRERLFNIITLLGASVFMLVCTINDYISYGRWRNLFLGGFMMTAFTLLLSIILLLHKLPSKAAGMKADATNDQKTPVNVDSPIKSTVDGHDEADEK